MLDRVAMDRRARRRQETIDEILDIAQAVMTEDGVNALSLAEVARRLGVQPPSLYKYFPSLLAVYDALFLRGQQEHLVVMRDAMAAAEPGLAALSRGPGRERALVARAPRDRAAALLASRPELRAVTRSVRAEHRDGRAEPPGAGRCRRRR